MTDYRKIEQQLTQRLGLTRRPIAVSYTDAPPPNVAKFHGTEPSGCSFWRLAAAGQTFQTQPSDHYNCPIGSYTHGIDLPQDRASELEGTLGLMVQIGYLKMEEVPGVFKLPTAPAAVSYAPLGDAPLAPSVVLVAGNPSQLTLLTEAAIRAGVYSNLPLLARPTCMALPAALKQGMVISGACTGNRVYTDLAEDELYAAIPGEALEKVLAELETIVEANAKLTDYHRARRASLASA